MKKKTTRLRIHIKEVPTVLKLHKDSILKMTFKQHMLTSLHLYAANRLMEKHKITEPGTYDIRILWSWKSPHKIMYRYTQVK